MVIDGPQRYDQDDLGFIQRVCKVDTGILAVCNALA